ncbi:MAG: hypothetical protein EOP53_20270 [Sphingobacteriales bacterium]|nr:MAG: hypothetical protein EOP53_20270 [Sphingobacteriales bacterium]
MQMAISTSQVFEKPTLKVWVYANDICPLKLKEGDKEAFKALYKFYAPLLYGSIRRNLKNNKSCDLVLEQTFLYAWRNISSYDESKCKMFTWLNRIAAKLASDNL